MVDPAEVALECRSAVPVFALNDNIGIKWQILKEEIKRVAEEVNVHLHPEDRYVEV